MTSPLSAAVIYSENFSSTTLADKPNSYLGGYYGSHVSFGEWVRSGSTVSVSGGNLQVGSDSGFRGAALLLSPSSFPSAGTYTLTFDVLSYTGDANDTATVAIWSGSGYDMTNSSANSLILNTQTGQLQALGSATSSQLSSTTYSAAGTCSVNFTYDGSSTIALFFAATTGGYPFPTVKYDNLSITSPSPVPETSVPMILGVAASFGLLRRRRP
ncbi:MAG TPA: hypothetical protein VGE67_08225 [Haloferula sp.]